MEMSLEPDLLRPSDVDWTQADDALVWHAARSGTAQAIEEMARRNSE